MLRNIKIIIYYVFQLLFDLPFRATILTKLIPVMIIRPIIRNIFFKKYGVLIGKNSIIGKGIKMPHPNNIIIGEGAYIHENVTIFQSVTIGGKIGSDGEFRYPNIHKGCIIYPNSVVVGGIEIGENTIVGACSYVNRSCEPNSVIGGVPAKLIKIQNIP